MNRLSEDDLVTRLRSISLPKENAPAPRVAENFTIPQPAMLAGAEGKPRVGKPADAGVVSSRSTDSFSDHRRGAAPAVLLGRKMSANRVGLKLGDKVTPRRAKKLGRELSGTREPARRRDILRTKLTAEEILEGLKTKYDFDETLDYMEAAQDFVQSAEAMKYTNAEPLLIPEVETLPPPSVEEGLQTDSQFHVGIQPSVDVSAVSSAQSPYIPSHFSHGGPHSLASTRSSQRRKKDPALHRPQLFFHRIDRTKEGNDETEKLPEVRPGTAERQAAIVESRVRRPGEVWSDVVALGGVPILLAVHRDFSRLQSTGLAEERDPSDFVAEANDLDSAASAGRVPMAVLLRRRELECVGLEALKDLAAMQPEERAPVVERFLEHLSIAPVPGRLSTVALMFRSESEVDRPRPVEEAFVDGMIAAATVEHAASAALFQGTMSDALGSVAHVRPELSLGSTIASAGLASPTIPPLSGLMSESSGDERYVASSDSEHSFGSRERRRRPGDRQVGTFSERARRRRKRERQIAVRQEDKYFNRPKEASSWDYDNNGYLWTHEQQEEDRRQPGYRDAAQRAASKREHDMEHAYRMKGKGGPAINDAGALSSAARQQPIRRSDAGSGTRSGARSEDRRRSLHHQPPRSRDRGDIRTRGGQLSHRAVLPSVGVGVAMRTLDDQLDDLFARESDRLDRSGRISDSRYIAKAHEEDLLRRGHLQRRRERGDQIKTLNNIEAITKTLPMAFLMEKGIGDLTVQHSFSVMVNVVNRALNAEMKAAWVVWTEYVNALNRTEFMTRANRFQQEEGLALLKRVMRRMLRARLGHRFQTWLAKTQKLADVATRALQEAKAKVIQRNFRIFLAHQKGVEFFKKIVRKKKQQAKDMAHLSMWIHNRSRMVGRHRRNKLRRTTEDNAAHVIIKNFRTKQGVKFMIKRIKATAARKAAELLALRIKSANTLQRWTHWYRCWYWPLEVRFRNRKRLLRMIKLGLITQAEASASSASDGEGEAEIIVDYELPAIEIQRGYRRHLQWIALISRFPRRKQMLEAGRFAAHLDLMAGRPQRMFRAYRLRYYLRHRVTARLFVSYRLLQPTVARSAAVIFIQRPLRNVMCREKLNFMFAARKVIMEAQYEKNLLAAAIKVQQAWRKSQGRYSEFILARARAAKAAARAAMEEEKRRRELYMRAVLKMQRNYRLSTGRFNLAQRFKDRRRQMAEQRTADRRKSAALSIQAQWRVHRGRTGISLQIQARLFKAKDDRRLAAHEHASCMVTRAGRRKREWEQLEARFDRRITLKRVQQDRLLRHDKANVIIKAWHDCNWRFQQPIRVVARYESVKKVREARRLRQWELEDKSARFIQRSWINRRGRILLQEMFDRRAEVLAAARRYALEMEMAKVIGFAVRKYQDKERVKMRTQNRRMQLTAQRLFKNRSESARKIQSCFHKYMNRKMLWRKFEARREELEAQDLQQRRVLEAKIAAQQARDAQDAARAALKQMEFAGWKMGADDHGRNYYYNLITGETQFERPEGWVPPQEELWVKNTTNTGLTYYFNQMSGETAWFPPCDECRQNEGTKICFDCPGTYCPGCFNKRHYPCCDPEKLDSSVPPPHDGCITDEHGKKMCEHLWKGADQDKEELGMGEIHCQKCQTKKAVRTSKLSRESFCLDCFMELHNTPWTSQIEWIPYEEFKKGWQEIKGRNPGDQDYYFNPMTREETYDKPMDLMNPEEKKEHVKFKQYQKASDKYVKKIDKLQHHIETLEYEKDTAFFEAQKKATLEQEELETLRELLSLREEKQKKVSWLKILKGPISYYLAKKRREARERALYRKQLLLSKKQRAEAAKKEAAEMAANAAGGVDGNGGDSRPTSPGT